MTNHNLDTEVLSREKSYIEVGERIISARKALGLKQKELAAGIGLSANFLSNMEKNIAPLQDRHLIAMELRYGINPDWIKTGTKPILIGIRSYDRLPSSKIKPLANALERCLHESF